MKVERTLNGYTITVKEIDSEGVKFKNVYSFEDSEMVSDFDPETCMRFLYELLEAMGIFLSNYKHEKKQLRISVEEINLQEVDLNSETDY